MLSLTRRIGESIVIGEDVLVTVLGCKGNQVRMGFNAPLSVPIHRYEICQKIQAEQQEALSNPTNQCASTQQSKPNNHK